jgi:thiamine monophosphate kinase
VNLRLIVTILVIAAAPICAQAQKPLPAKVTKADAQKVLKIISSDKAKTRIYCQMAKLGEQMVQANEAGDSKKFAALFQKMYELGKKLGPEYAALIDGLQDIDPEAEVGQEISSTLDALDNLCGG